MSGSGAGKRGRLRLVALLAMSIAAGCFILKLVLFMTGRPTISVNYAVEYNERLRPAGLDPNDNAAPLYREAFAHLPAPSGISSLWEHEPNSSVWKTVESWIASGDEAMRIVCEAARKPGFWVELSTINFNDPASAEELDFPKFRQAAMDLGCKAQYLAIQGDLTGAFDCIFAICQMGQHVGKRGRMGINVGQAMEAFAVGTAFDLLSEVDVDSELLREFHSRFEEIVRRKTPPSFAGDEILLRDAIQRYFTDNGKGDGHLIPGAIYDLSVRGRAPTNELAANATYLRLLYTAWHHPSRQQTARTLASVVESANRLVQQPPWELHAKGTDHVSQLGIVVERNYFLRSLIIDKILGRTMEIHHRIRTSSEALIVTMAILQFREDKGAWPRSLEELAAGGYIQHIPVDPFSGQPLAYKQTDGSFTLYSWGEDFDDDGGTRSRWGNLPEGGDQVFWPVEEHKK